MSNEIRAESKVHLEKWTREHEQALKDIRPFDESMLQAKEATEEIVEQQQLEKIGSGLNIDQ